MDYKSNRSEKFRAWLGKTLSVDENASVNKIVELERCARLLTHFHALTGDIKLEDMNNLTRAVKRLQDDYESE